MRVRHLNCATMCPPGARHLGLRAMVCHCLLIEGPRGLVLVDTGLGTAEIQNPWRRIPEVMLLLGPRLATEETALHQLRALGHRPEDVTDIVLTHLDFDHAGGLADFPSAQVHVLATELEAATARRGALGRRRYHPRQWAHGPRWVLHRPLGETWEGFQAVRALPGGSDAILLVPLAGHTVGHAGVAVRHEGGWLLHCGDAYFHHATLGDGKVPATIAAFERALEVDRPARLTNQDRLRRLARERSGAVTIFSSHDIEEYERLAAAPAERPPLAGVA